MTNITDFSSPFRPRARLLQLLGDELIGSSRLAVFELVKNAYDADAELVTITLSKLNTSKASITVEDDGVGMSVAIVRDIWLVLGHDHRAIQKNSNIRTALNRLPLGEKGLGRFAVHKLGDHVKLVTRAAGQPECVVDFDWSKLMDQEFLDQAMVPVVSRVPEVFTGKRTGTQITIENLRNSNWSRGDVRRLLRQITSISTPFGKGPDRFRAKLQVPDHPDWIANVPDVEALLARAPWKFRFAFEKGKLSWEYEFRGVTGINVSPRTSSASETPLLIAPERDVDLFNISNARKMAEGKVIAEDSFADGIGPVTGEFYVFDRDNAVLSRLGDAALVKNFLDSNGGIRIYRDGIRVYNYGEPGDDWLGLDIRRVNTPTRNISQNIVVGALELSLEQSAALKEKTNREGFIENEAYSRLRQLVLGAISILETERKIDKDSIRKLTRKGYNPEVEKIQRPLHELRLIAQKHNVSAEMDPLIDRIERDYEDMKDTLLRAGVNNVSLAVVFHEIEQGMRVLYKAIEGGGRPEDLKIQAHELIRILDGFTELLRKGEKKNDSLKNLVRRVRDMNQVRFRYHNVRLVNPALEDAVEDIEANFAFGLALGALNNIYDNAFHWLKVKWPENTVRPWPRAIYTNIIPDFAEGPAVIVADTGPGFQDDKETLVRPFFTRRPEGMGLGLYYANMVMELNGGRLVFPTPEEADLPPEFTGAIVGLVFGRKSSR